MPAEKSMLLYIEHIMNWTVTCTRLSRTTYVSSIDTIFRNLLPTQVAAIWSRKSGCTASFHGCATERKSSTTPRGRKNSKDEVLRLHFRPHRLSCGDIVPLCKTLRRGGLVLDFRQVIESHLQKGRSSLNSEIEISTGWPTDGTPTRYQRSDPPDEWYPLESIWFVVPLPGVYAIASVKRIRDFAAVGFVEYFITRGFGGLRYGGLGGGMSNSGKTFPRKSRRSSVIVG